MRDFLVRIFYIRDLHYIGEPLPDLESDDEDVDTKYKTKYESMVQLVIINISYQVLT
jgi:hypothetical protein